MSESNSLLQLGFYPILFIFVRFHFMSLPVDRPYECSLDTSVVKGVAEIMLEGSSGLSTNLREFNPEEFGSKLIAFVSGRNDESTFAYLDILNSDFNKWAAFGADCAAQMHLVSAPLSYHCLSANSGAEVGLAKRKRRRRSGSAESPIAGSVRRVVLEPLWLQPSIDALALTGSHRRVSDLNIRNQLGDSFADHFAYFAESDPLAIIKFPEELTDSERLLKQSFEIYSLTAKLVQEHSKCETDMKLRIPIPQEVAAATEEAKRLVKAGTMTVQKAEQRTTFKRPVKLARRLERVGNGLIPSKQAEPFDSGFNYSFDEAIFPGNTNIYNRPSNSGTYYATESCIPNSSSLSSEKSSAEPFSKSVYIRSGHISEESIRDCFSKFGTIVGIKRGVYDKSAIVDFETSRAASAAVEEMNGRHIDGLPLTVSIANAQLCRAFNEYPPFLSEAQKPACPDSRHAVCYEDEEQ
ncbi:hypothetical protein D918_02754 [Trichuris suis]|nr:hypothetical protein D918_02754 [Trichuris suis]